MAASTSFIGVGVQFHVPTSNSSTRASLFSQSPPFSVSITPRPKVLKSLRSPKLKPNTSFFTKRVNKFGHSSRSLVVRCEASSSGRVLINEFMDIFFVLSANDMFVIVCLISFFFSSFLQWQITHTEFTEMAWQTIVASPEVAKENKHQIVETEHLMKALLEQKNGLARRIFSKLGVDNTRLLEATDKFIKRQPKVTLTLNCFYLLSECISSFSSLLSCFSLDSFQNMNFFNVEIVNCIGLNPSMLFA